MRRLVVATLAALALAACAPAPPSDSPTARNPAIAVTPAVDQTAVHSLSDDEHARRITLRIRNVNCAGLGIGSAVAIGPRLLATNRHVVEGADELQVETWDGRAITVRTAQIARDQDLAIVRVDSDLPAAAELAASDPVVGETLSAVGFPLGGQFERSAGAVVDYTDGSAFGEVGRIMRTAIPLRHGNSGGAVLNEQGQVAGVAFAIETRTGYGLVIPASTLSATVSGAQFGARSGCEAVGSQ